MYVIQLIRSLLFNIQMYVAMAVMAFFWFMPLAVFDRRYAYDGVRTYCRYVRWSARWMIGLDSEVRGKVPQCEVLIAAKHQSFFDIIMLVSVLPRPKFIMKASLRFAPILGWFAMRMGCVPVDRGKRGAAIEKMKRDVEAGMSLPGQLVIYPQGTRVAPGAARQYKVGTAILYEQLSQPCVPVAVNVGVFWPRHGFYRKQGLAVLEFLPTIPVGRPHEDFMTEMETVIETRSNQLMADAGFDVNGKD